MPPHALHLGFCAGCVVQGNGASGGGPTGRGAGAAVPERWLWSMKCLALS